MEFLEKSFIPKKAFDVFNAAEKCYKKSGAFSSEILETLHSYFDQPFTAATELLERSQITCYSTKDQFRKVYEVSTSQEQYTILENINYCQCDFFKNQVLDSRSNITCQHVLVVYLAKIMEKVQKETLSETVFQEYLDIQLHTFLDVESQQQL